MQANRDELSALLNAGDAESEGKLTHRHPFPLASPVLQLIAVLVQKNAKILGQLKSKQKRDVPNMPKNSRPDLLTDVTIVTDK